MYARPQSIEEALSAVAASRGRVVCGGTDLYPAHVGRTMPENIVDISGIPSLRGITETDDGYRIGGATSWSSIARAPLPEAFHGLQAAAREVGSVQIQNRGTIAGNLCNASPAADGVPPLLALDAAVELGSVRGRRQLPLASFITGYRQTALTKDEIVTAIVVPKPALGARSAFAKLGTRRYLVISILMASAVVQSDERGNLVRAAVAIGAASPVAQRLPALEAALAGLPSDVRPSSIVDRDHLAGLTPIDDVRATAGYRMEAALTVIGEALDRAAGVWPLA